MPDGISAIVKMLEDQKAAIDRALNALREVDGAEPAKPAAKRGRPAKKKGGMTPEGKQRLVAALKKRWAAKHAAAKKAARAAKKAVAST